MSDDADDEDLAIRMMCGDQAALREFLRGDLEALRQLLSKRYGRTVQPSDLEEALNRAAYTLWNKAGEYDKSKGTLRAWVFVIAQRGVIDIFRREKRYRLKHPLLPVDYEASDDCDPVMEELTREESREVKDMKDIIARKLKGQQKAILEADLIVGGKADAGSLAERLNTTKDSIYSSRSQAYKTIRKEMTQLAHTRERMRGKK